MNLSHLSSLTGHLSVSEMSTADLLEHVLLCRSLRILPRPPQSTGKTKSPSAEPKLTTKKPKLPDPSKMSQQELELLLKQLGG